MISKKEDKIRGKKAANKGIANEHIALGILMHKYNASKIVKGLSVHIDGSGGGQEFFATAGGKKINGIGKLLKMAQSYL